MVAISRVQSLANSVGLTEMPEQFVRPAEERPENSKAIEGVSVPVISLAQPRDVVVHEMHEACREWGFFAVTDHGVPAELIGRLQEVGRKFFELPPEEKELYANDPSNAKFEGYGTKMTKNSDEKLEWIDYFFHLMAPHHKVDYQVWPRNPPSYRSVTEEYNKEMERVTNEILEALSEGLGLQKTVLKSCLGEMILEMKINMYPPCPQPQVALGVEAHTDMSALTILVANEVPGLQVWKDDNWVAVNYIPNALFVHIGDQIEVLSNGIYKSVLHRSLVNKKRTRMSWAVFVTPLHEVMIGPAPQLVDTKNPPKYSTKTFADYRYRKFNKLPQ